MIVTPCSGVLEGTGVPDGEFIGVRVGVPLGVVVDVGVGVLLGVGILVRLGVSVSVGVSSSVGVGVGVSVEAGVSLGVTEILGVADGVAVSVGVREGGGVPVIILQVVVSEFSGPFPQLFTGVTIHLYVCPPTGVKSTFLSDVVFSKTVVPAVWSRTFTLNAVALLSLSQVQDPLFKTQVGPVALLGRVGFSCNSVAAKNPRATTVIKTKLIISMFFFFIFIIEYRHHT